MPGHTGTRNIEGTDPGNNGRKDAFQAEYSTHWPLLAFATDIQLVGCKRILIPSETAWLLWTLAHWLFVWRGRDCQSLLGVSRDSSMVRDGSMVWDGSMVHLPNHEGLTDLKSGCRAMGLPCLRTSPASRVACVAGSGRSGLPREFRKECDLKAKIQASRPRTGG